MTDSSDQGAACLFCGRAVAWMERRCPAFTLAGVAAHAECCGGCGARIAVADGAPAEQPGATP